MKKTSLGRRFAAAVMCLLLCAAFMSGCADKDTDALPVQTTAGQNTIDSDKALMPDGGGVRAEHITSAGFDMGADTLDSFSKKFGAPVSTDTKEYSAETVTTAQYDFGTVEFDGPNDGAQVLTYVAVTGELAGPCLVTKGDDVLLTADAIFTDSSAKIREIGDETSVMLYGGGDDASSGQYMLLESEYVTSDMSEESCLVYIVPVSGGRVRYTIYVDANNSVTRYEMAFEK